MAVPGAVVPAEINKKYFKIIVMILNKILNKNKVNKSYGINCKIKSKNYKNYEFIVMIIINYLHVLLGKGVVFMHKLL